MSIVNVIAIIMVIVIYFTAFAFAKTRLENVIAEHTEVGKHKLRANWALVSYLKMQAGNVFMIVFTFGLFLPFAKVRSARYRAEHTKILLDGPLHDFVAGEKAKISSFAEGVGDVFSMDVSL